MLDTDIGTAPEHLNYVWELLHRLKTYGPEAGKVLGLTLMRYQGDIRADSDPGQGSRLIVELPFYAKERGCGS